MSEATLVVEDAAVSYGGVVAVDKVSFAVGAGELLGVIGPNGSGKSSLLGAVSRLTPLAGGRLILGGLDFTERPAHAINSLGMARTFQTVRLDPTMTVLQNVMVGADSTGRSASPVRHWTASLANRRSERRSRDAAALALERVGIPQLSAWYPTELSYGTQRRVEIARAMASDPHVLLLDEPAAGMNSSERDELCVLFEALREQGLAQVLVEHDLAMVHRLSTHAIALNFGRLIAEGTARDVAATPQVQEAYMGVSTSLHERARDHQRRGRQGTSG